MDDAVDGAADRQRRPYSGYSQTAVPPEDLELTHVAPGTPGGEYMRRFWHPVALTQELADLPLPVRILGEDLVLFRTPKGEIGLLHRHCCHRATSLVYGRITERGLQCCYHGWHFAPDGRILETPGEPPTSRIREMFFQGAYPVREYQGLVFACMGPPDDVPPFPIYDTFEWPDTESAVFSAHFPCNWLQVHENCMDPFHATWLHALHGRTQLTPAWGAAPLLDWRETPLGMMTSTIRRVGDMLWVTSVDCVLPNLRQTGIWEDAAAERSFARSAMSVWITPIDDRNSMMIGFRFYNDEVDPNRFGRKELNGKESCDCPGQTAGRSLAEAQRDPNDWEANTSQRPVAVHRLEHLGTTDKGVAMLRRLVRRGIRKVQEGGKVQRPEAGETGRIPSYVHDTVLKIPPRTPAAADEAMMRDVQQRVTNIVQNQEVLHASDRRETVKARHFALRDEVIAQG